MSGFTEDPKAQRDLENQVGKKVLGVECPKKNRTGDICKECDRVAKLWRANTADSDKEARARQAKDSYFLNVQLEDGEFTALKIGKKVANSLKKKSDRYKERHNAPFGFANIDGKGRWLEIHKSGEYPNFEYELEVLDEVAEPVDVGTVKALPPLNNITEDFNAGILPLKDISAIPTETHLKFRIVPIPTNEGQATEMVYRYYHWRCFEADILGGEDVDSIVETGTEIPREFSDYMGVDTATDEGDTAPTPVEKYTVDNTPDCFGYFDNQGDCFDPDCEDIVTVCAEKAGYHLVDGEYVKKPAKKKKAKA